MSGSGPMPICTAGQSESCPFSARQIGTGIESARSARGAPSLSNVINPDLLAAPVRIAFIESAAEPVKDASEEESKPRVGRDPPTGA